MTPAEVQQRMAEISRWDERSQLEILAEMEAEEAKEVKTAAGAPASPLDLGKLVFRQAFQLGRHTEYLNARLLEVAAGSIDRLLVTMPPRHFKSETCSHLFPAWFLCNNPDKRVILAGYGSSFAEEWGRKTRNTVEEFGDLWGVRVDHRSKAGDRWDIEGHRGGMHTAGIGGPLTGRGADLLIIDDPIKDQAEAFSAVFRKRVSDWYQSVAYTRLAPGAKAVLVQTRWHDEDLAGRLLAAAREQGADTWHTVNFPAVAEEHDVLGRQPGEALFPERYSLEDLNRIRANLTNDFWWHALYQQHPPREFGQVIDADLLRGFTIQGEFYRLWTEMSGGEQIVSVHPSTCLRITTVDCAGSSEDVAKEAKGHVASYSVISTFDVTQDGKFILRDLVRGRWAFPRLVEEVQSAINALKPAWTGIEDEKTGRALLQTLTPKGYNLRALQPEGKDKLTRAAELLNRLKARQVFIGRESPWRKDLTSEFVMWTGHPDEQSDQIDTFAYACREWQRTGGMTIQLQSPVFAGELGGGSVLRRGGW